MTSRRTSSLRLSARRQTMHFVGHVRSHPSEPLALLYSLYYDSVAHNPPENPQTRAPHPPLRDLVPFLESLQPASLRSRLLVAVTHAVKAGSWGDPHTFLQDTNATNITVSPALLQLWEAVLAHPADVSLLERTLVTDPQSLRCYHSLLLLFEDREDLPYIQRVFDLLRTFRNALRQNELSIAQLRSISRLSESQRRELSELAIAGRANEDLEYLELAMEKAVLMLGDVERQIAEVTDFAKGLSRPEERFQSLRSTIQQFLEGCANTPLKEFHLPDEILTLKQSGEIDVSNALIEVDNWLESLFSAQQLRFASRNQHANSAFPLSIPQHLPHFVSRINPLFPFSEKLEIAKRELISLSFPELLLHVTFLRESDKEKLTLTWFQTHRLLFADWVQSPGVENWGKFSLLVAFTHDSNGVNTLQIECEKMRFEQFDSVESCAASVERFANQTRNSIYLLQISAKSPEVRKIKEILEEIARKNAVSNKTICLILCFTREKGGFSTEIEWDSQWKMATFENLGKRFAESIEDLQLWLEPDLKSQFSGTKGVSSSELLISILSKIYENIPNLNVAVDCRIADILACEGLISTFEEWALNDFSDVQEKDWRVTVLKCDVNDAFEDLKDAKIAIFKEKTTALFRKMIEFIEENNAFPSLFCAQKDSPMRRIWFQTVRRYVAKPCKTPQSFPIPPSNLSQIPFICLDWRNLVLPCIDKVTKFDDFEYRFFKRSVIGLNFDNNQELMDRYIRDLSRFGLTHFIEDGETLFSYITESEPALCSKVKSFIEHFEAVRSLCTPVTEGYKIPLLVKVIRRIFEIRKACVKAGKPHKSRVVSLIRDYNRAKASLSAVTATLNFAKNSTIWSVDCLKDEFAQPSLQCDFSSLNCVSLPDGRVLVVGGKSNSLWTLFSLQSVSFLILRNLQKENTGSMQQLRIAPGLVMCVSSVYAFGGDSEEGFPLPTCEVFDTAAKTWTLLPARMTYPRSHFSPCAHPPYIYVCGSSPSLSIEVYNAQRGVFSQVTPAFLPEAGSTLAIMCDSEIVIITNGHHVKTPVREDGGIDPVVWERHEPFAPYSVCSPVVILGEAFIADGSEMLHKIDLESPNFTVSSYKPNNSTES